MAIRRLCSVVLACLLVQGGVFAWMYDDLIYLRRPPADLLRGGPDAFTRQASRALERRSLTRAHLDTIAETARLFALTHLEVAAVERRLSLDPEDRQITLQLADALRRHGDLARAGQVFRALLEETP